MNTRTTFLNYYLQPKEKKNTLQEHSFINTISNRKQYIQRELVELVSCNKERLNRQTPYLYIYLTVFEKYLTIFVVRFSVMCVHLKRRHYIFNLFITLKYIYNFASVNWFILYNQPNIGGIDALVEHLLLHFGIFWPIFCILPLKSTSFSMVSITVYMEAESRKDLQYL